MLFLQKNFFYEFQDSPRAHKHRNITNYINFLL